MCELGKGPGPYSRLKTWVSRETGAQAAFRLNSGEGYPHAAVPGYYCNVWATEEQRLANDAEQRFALPPVSNSKSKKKQSQDPFSQMDLQLFVPLFSCSHPLFSTALVAKSKVRPGGGTAAVAGKAVAVPQGGQGTA